MIAKRNLILPVALVAALIGGSVGALVVRKQDTSADTPTTLASTPVTTAPATYSDGSTIPSAQFVNASTDQLAANNSQRFSTTQEQLAYREGFADGVLDCANNTTSSNRLARANYAAPRSVVSSGRRVTSSSSSRRVYYDYGNQPRGRSFWTKHRDKLTVGMGTGAGALIGGLIGGKRGAGIGALAGAGGSALYTYKLRNRTRRY
ncbi:MAG: hypothetical protein QOD75_1198 [Blastocatellia bacterium]|jgi:hypothetical protein|nr:hypothetical protein [Blastocatellia bacterium]